MPVRSHTHCTAYWQQKVGHIVGFPWQHIIDVESDIKPRCAMSKTHKNYKLS